MRSDRKSTAKGSSRCRSCGPRTAAGKAIASRNALKHGLSAIVYRPAAPSAEIERFAKSLCGQERKRSPPRTGAGHRLERAGRCGQLMRKRSP